MRYLAGAVYVAPMASRGEFIGEVLVQLMERKGIGPQELADLAAVSYNHVINLRQNNKRASPAMMRKLARALGVTIARFVEPAREPMESMGRSFALGFVKFETEPVVPGSIEIVEPVGIFYPGDIVWVARGDFEVDRWLLVEGVEGEVAIVKGVEELGVRLLLTGRGEEVRFRPDAHRVLGVITRFERSC